MPSSRESAPENLLVAIERLCGPVLGGLRKQAMFDRVPLGSASRIVSHRHGEIEGISELRLELSLPGMAVTTIAATGVGENQEHTQPPAWDPPNRNP